MTPHLSPGEFVDAADGTLAAARLQHVDGCDACRDQLVVLRQLAGDVDLAAEVPEPSPLFWEHFSQRVRLATAALPPSAPAWWQGWRTLPLGALLSAAVMLIAVAVRHAPVPDPGSGGRAVAVASGAALSAGEVVPDDGAMWDLMVTMASDLSADDLHHVAAPMTGVADTMATDLTAAQQQEFVRLIRREMGGAE